MSDEIAQGIETGHTFLEPAGNAIGASEFEVVVFDATLAGQFEAERERLDLGEFEAFLVAWENDWMLATDDAAGRRVAKAERIDVTGSVGLLVRGVLRDDLSITRANGWLNTWIEERGYYAPVDRVEDALPDDET